MFHIGMTQWIVGDEPLEVSCARLKNCGYDGIELAAQPYHLDAGACKRLLDKYGLDCRSLCGIFERQENGRFSISGTAWISPLKWAQRL